MRGGYFDSLGAGARLWGALPAALMLSALAPALITQASAANCTVVQGTVTLNGGACAIAPDTTLRPNPVAVTANGGQITADGVTIIPAGLRSSTGLSSSGASGAITASNLDLNMTGDGGFAADAEGGSIITLNNGVRISFNSVGNANTGLIASGQGSRIVTNGATLAMPGSGALGGLDELVIAQTGGAVTLNGGSFSLTGAATSEIGWLARDRGTITASNTSLTVSGSGGDTGVLGTSFSPISLNRVTVIMPGSSAGETGLLVNEPFALITGNAVSVSVPSSDGGNGIYATGGSIRLAGNNTVSTGGDHAVAVQASGPFSSITVDQTTISTIGPRSPGVSADGGGSVTLTGGSSVSTSGTLSTGLIAWGDGSSISGNTLTVSTSGAGSPGGVLLDGGNITLTGGSVTTTGAGSPGFVFQGQPLGSLTIDGTAADLGDRLRDGGERRVGGRALRHAVEADDRDVARHVESVRRQGAHRANRHLVVRAEHRAEFLLPREERLDRANTRLHREVARRDERHGRRNPGLLQRRFVTVPAIDADRTVGRAGHECDAAVTERQQMIDGDLRRRDVVDAHARDVAILHVFAGIDDRQASAHLDLRQMPHQRDQPVDLSRGDHVGIRLLAREAALRVAEQNRISALVRDLLHAADHFREKRIRDVGDERDDEARPRRAQVARLRIRSVAEALDRFVHALASFRADDLGPLQRARYRRDGNLRGRGHGADILHAARDHGCIRRRRHTRATIERGIAAFDDNRHALATPNLRAADVCCTCICAGPPKSVGSIEM